MYSIFGRVINYVRLKERVIEASIRKMELANSNLQFETLKLYFETRTWQFTT